VARPSGLAVQSLPGDGPQLPVRRRNGPATLIDPAGMRTGPTLLALAILLVVTCSACASTTLEFHSQSSRLSPSSPVSLRRPESRSPASAVATRDPASNIIFFHGLSLDRVTTK
jgi:hypothetical protein